MKLILASNNKGKVVEFREILAGTGIEVIPQREAGCELGMGMHLSRNTPEEILRLRACVLDFTGGLS